MSKSETAVPVAALAGVQVVRGQRTVLRDLTLDVLPGELLTVVGPSGAGKSTLLALLAGLLGADAGQVRRPEQDGGSTRVVFQEPRLLPWRTTAENVRLGLEYRANGGRGFGHAHDADGRVTRLLTELGIGDLAGRMPDQLSGGQAQRVAIARAVAADPTLLLLDEPFSALDPITRGDAQEWLRQVHHRLGLSTVLVTHDLSEAARLGDRVAVLRPGGRIEIFTADGDDHEALQKQLLTGFSDDQLAQAEPDEPEPSAPGANRREFLTVAAAGALVALPLIGGAVYSSGSSRSAPAVGDDQAGDRPTLRIGYLPITDAAPLLIAHDAGEFASRRIDTPEPTLFRGWSNMVEALQGGSIDVAHLLMPLAMQLRYDAGVPIKVLAWNHVNGSALTVAQRIDRLGDLAGATVAIPGWFSIHNVVLQQLLRSRGLTAVIDTAPSAAGRTVQLVVMAPSDMPVALGNGSIAGYIVAEPFCAAAEVQGVGKILRFSGDTWREHACCVTVVREDLVDRDPELAQRVADAVVAAQCTILDDRAGAAERLSAGGYLPQPPAAIARVLVEHDHTQSEYQTSGAITHPDWDEPRIGFQPYAYPSYTQRLVEELRNTTVDARTGWLSQLDPAAVHADLVSVDINRRAVEAAGGFAAFGAAPQRDEVIAP